MIGLLGLIVVAVFPGSAIVAEAQTSRSVDTDTLVDANHVPKLENHVSSIVEHQATWELIPTSEQLVIAYLLIRCLVREMDPPRGDTLCVAFHFGNRLEDPPDGFLTSLHDLGRTFVPRLTYHEGRRGVLRLPGDRALVVTVPWQGPIGKIGVAARLGDIEVFLLAIRSDTGWVLAEHRAMWAIECGIGH